MPAAAEAGQRKEGQGGGQTFRPHKIGGGYKDGRGQQQQAAGQGFPPVQTRRAGQNPHGQEGQQCAQQRRHGEEHGQPLRRGAFHQGVQPTQIPEIARPETRPRPGGQPEILLQPALKGKNGGGFARTVQAVAQQGGPGQGQQQQQRRKGPQPAQSIEQPVRRRGG